MLMVLFVISMMLVAASLAVAGTQSVMGSGTIGVAPGSSLSLATSSNVTIIYNGSTQAYGASSKHAAGNRLYATGNATPGIFYKDDTAGAINSTDPTSGFDGSGWTAQ